MQLYREPERGGKRQKEREKKWLITEVSVSVHNGHLPSVTRGEVSVGMSWRTDEGLPQLPSFHSNLQVLEIYKH
jgi:hypothetical protein